MTAVLAWLRRSLALVLCVLVSPLPALCMPEPAPAPPAPPEAGQVVALISSASRNSSPALLREAIAWNDLLQTDRSGRMRLTLKDGSILSVGPETELRVVQHDPEAQQTQLDLQHGRLRSRVVSLTRTGARFEVRTPTAVVHVVGTDFFLNQSADGKLQLIVYSGHVLLAGTGKLAGQEISVSAGQFVEAGPAGITAPQATPAAVQQDSINSTTIEGAGANGEPAVASGHMLRTVLIVLGVAAVGAATGIAASSGGGHAVQPAAASAPAQAAPAASKPAAAVSKKK